jgi:hypothetical protein
MLCEAARRSRELFDKSARLQGAPVAQAPAILHRHLWGRRAQCSAMGPTRAVSDAVTGTGVHARGSELATPYPPDAGGALDRKPFCSQMPILIFRCGAVTPTPVWTGPHWVGAGFCQGPARNTGQKKGPSGYLARGKPTVCAACALEACFPVISHHQIIGLEKLVGAG